MKNFFQRVAANRRALKVQRSIWKRGFWTIEGSGIKFGNRRIAEDTRANSVYKGEVVFKQGRMPKSEKARWVR